MAYNQRFSWYDPSNIGSLQDPTNAEANVLKKTVDTSFKPYEQQVGANLKRRGFSFGNDLYSPTIEAGAYAPLAQKKTSALTDLWFKSESDKRAWNQDKRTGMLAEVNYGAAEDSRAAAGKSSAAKVLCTELHRQGLVKGKYLRADLKFLEKYVTKEIHSQYLAWGTPLANRMKKSKVITMLVYIPVFFWNMYMYRMVNNERLGILGSVGKWVNRMGVKYGRFYASKMRKAVV